MESNAIDVAALCGMFSGVVTIAMQMGFKTLLEQLPFMKNQAVHDAVLRLVVIGLNAGLIVAAALTTNAFADLQWFDLVALAFGQAVVSHGAYKVITDAQAPAVADVPPVGVLVTQAPPDSASAS